MKGKYNKPNFLIVGAAKAGTTSLANYLNELPEIFIPKKKELRFFIKDIIKKTNPNDPLLKGILGQSILDELTYFNLYNEDKSRLAGDASVHYLYHYEKAIPNIHKYVGDIPIIIILRNPVERAISNWKFNGKDFQPFINSLKMETERKSKNYNSFWFYLEQGLYYEPIKAYSQKFSNVKILIFEKFIKDVSYYFKDILDFLEISNPAKVDLTKIHNKKGMLIPKSKVLREIFQSICRNKYILNKLYELLPNNLFETKEELLYEHDFKKSITYLNNYYKDEIIKIEEFLNYSIPEWHRTY